MKPLKPQLSPQLQRLRTAACPVLLGLLLAPGILAAPVELDPGFDTDGTALTSPVGGVASTANSLLSQADSKLVAVGSSNADVVLVRYHPDGSLDTGFDTDGVVQKNINATDVGFAVRQQTDGKLVVSASTGGGIVLVRFNPDGSTDSSFGSSGVAIATSTTGCTYSTNPGGSLVQQADGKWVLSMVCSFGSSKLVRLSQSGALDSTFGAAGLVSNGQPMNAVALQADGKIVVSGCTLSGFTCAVLRTTRYNSNGTLDNTFGSNGVVQTDIPGAADNANALLVQPDGKILVAGNNGSGSATNTHLVRYNSDGSLDTGFGTGGLVETAASTGVEIVKALQLQASGRIVVAGYASNGNNNDVMLMRYNVNGSLDTHFDTDGIAFLDQGASEQANALVLQSDGKAVIAGSGNISGLGQVLVARFVLPPASDIDADGIEDEADNCVAIANADQANIDQDASGDVCDSTPYGDTDSDTVDNLSDNCPSVVNPDQQDADVDGVGNACDASSGATEDPRVIGEKVYASGGNVYVRVMNAEAGYTSELHLSSPGPGQLIATNRDVGTIVNLGSYPAGTELVFSIYVRETGNTFATGPASRNPDNMIHAAVSLHAGGLSTVGFEDLHGGGDQDYNDNMFRFLGIVVLDTDGDGVPDTQDPDQDGDGVPNAEDVFPLDATETVDTDSDGTGNVADTDDDGDSLTDTHELELGTNPLLADTDYDRVPDGVDPLPLGLDTGFSADGLVLTSPVDGVASTANSLLRQADSKLVAVGSSNADVVLVRYHPDGSLDTGFDTDGVVQKNINATDVGFAVRQQTDGKLVVSASTGGGIVLVRFNPDGSTDSSFGSSGVAIATSTTGCTYGTNPGGGLVQQADGKWVLSMVCSLGSSKLVRLSQNGVLDSTFGAAGLVSNGQPMNVVALQADGKIVVSGCTLSGFTCAVLRTTRYNSNGTLDNTFGSNGVVQTDIPGAADNANALLVQPDGKILVAGNNGSGSATNTHLVRYNSDGSLDTGFGTGGLVETAASTGVEIVKALQLQASGRIVVAGYASNGINNDVMLLRYQPDGSLDPYFDGDGMTFMDLGATEQGNALVLVPDGRAIVAGHSNLSSISQFLLAAFVSPAIPDTDADGVDDGLDAFPTNAAETTDTDSDGIGNNADSDDDGDTVPDYLDVAPLDAGNNSEITLPLNGGYKGLIIRDVQAVH